jgi:hypothetical protein
MSVIQGRQIKKQMRLARKVDSIMRETHWNGLRTAKNQRLLSYISIGSLFVYLAFYVTWGRASGGTIFMNWGGMPPYALFFAMVGIVATFLLGKSVRHITTLPNQFLDERQKEIRNAAFRQTYKYLIRIAAGMVLVAVLVKLLQTFGPLGDLRSWIDALPMTQLPNGAFTESPWSYFFLSLLGAIQPSTSNMVFYGGALVLLGWAMPIVLIAWNEAKHGGGADS